MTLLSQAGELLYGSRWQSELARDVGVSDRTVRRWISGESPVPRRAYSRLAEIAQDRSEAIRKLRPMLACPYG